MVWTETVGREVTVVSGTHANAPLATGDASDRRDQPQADLAPRLPLSVGLGHEAADNGDFCSRAEAGTLFHVATAERAGAGEWGPPGGASFLYVVATCALAIQDLLRENWKGDTLQPDPASSALEKILFALVKFGDGPTPPSRSDQGAIPAVPRPRRPLPATPSAKS